MLVTNVGGLAEIVPDGTVGYVCPVDETAIADAIRRFAEMNKEERDAWRNDTFTTFPESAGDQYVSNNVQEQIDIPDSVFDEVRRRWEAGEPG